MNYDRKQAPICSTEPKEYKKSTYVTPTIQCLDIVSDDIASGGPNAGPDGTFGNNS